MRHRRRDSDLRPWQFSLGQLLAAVTVASLVIAGAIHLRDYWLITLWSTSLALQFGFGLKALRNRNIEESQSLSAMASIPPLLTWLLFLVVFVIGGSSNVAQMAQPTGMHLWRLWEGFWILALYANPIALFMAVASALMPPLLRENASSWVSRACGIIACLLACYAILEFAPDA